jgi:hypothetical protein
MAKSTVSRPSSHPAPKNNGPTDAVSTVPAGRVFIPLELISNSVLRTRDINEKHVVALAESIGAIGLIHPPAVDQSNRLLAGAHRLGALRWLQDHSNARFLELFPNGIPVWRMNFDASSDIDLALAVEISENEQRRDYSSTEILKLADRLKAAGFHYSAEGGRPKVDSRPLMPALEIIVGKSVRQLRRILNPIPPTEKKSQPKTRPSDLVSDLKNLHETSEKLVQRLISSSNPEFFTLKAQLERVNRLILLELAVFNKTD